MLAFFYEDRETITVREYKADNFLCTANPEMTREIRYNLNYIDDYKKNISGTDYMAKVIKTVFEENNISEMPIDSVPLILIFSGCDRSLWSYKSIEGILYSYRHLIHIIPADYTSDEVNDFVARIFSDRNIG